jgi:oxalate decarboxylase family bicupin protein
MATSTQSGESFYLPCITDPSLTHRFPSVTFNLGDWILHTPKSILAKNFGVNETVFANLTSDPYISQAANVSTHTNITGGAGPLTGNASYVYRTFDHPSEPVPGNGGTFYKIDSTNFPIAKTIAATYVTLKPGGLRELHWHPTAEEWLYFHRGEGRATVFIGNAAARTFNFQAGDTAVFPDNSGECCHAVCGAEHEATDGRLQGTTSRIPPRQRISCGSRSTRAIASRISRWRSGWR